MATALDALSRAVKSQNNEKDTKVLYPFARTLPPGRSVRDLSMPPIQAVFGCLRQVKGSGSFPPHIPPKDQLIW